MDSAMTHEERLCLLLAQGRVLAPAKEEALALLAQPLRWDLVLERAQQHQVYPLLYRNLKALSFPGVPEQFRTELEALFQVNTLRNTLLAEEQASLLAMLHQAGVPVIPLKGLFLAESLYGDRNLRVCADIDLLVPRRQVAQAFALLLARGYEAEFPRWPLTDRMMTNSIEHPLWRRKRELSCLAELHWALVLEASGGERSLKDLWAEARREAFLGVPVIVLSAEWQFLFLLVHAARHNWQCLKWLVDIHETYVQGRFDWEKVAAKSERFGWEHLVRWSLSASHFLLDTPLPQNFSLELPLPQTKLYPAPPWIPTPWQIRLSFLRLARRPAEKLRLLARRLLIPTAAECALCPLPSSLAFLYYLLRPVRLAYVVGRSLLSTLPRTARKFLRWTTGNILHPS